MKKLLPLVLLFVSPLAFAAINLSLEGLLSLVIYLVIVGLIFWCVWWALGYFAIPEPFNRVIRVILGLIALVVVVNILLGLIGSPMFTFK